MTVILQKLNIHQAKCAAWWTSEHSSAGRATGLYPARRGFESFCSDPAKQESSFAGSLKVFILSFVKVIGNGTMTAVGVILKCHHNGTLPQAGGNMSRRFESGRSDWDIIHPTTFRNFSLYFFYRPVIVKIMGLYFYKGCND